MKMDKKVEIFEYALEMEKDGENYYRQLAGQCEKKGLKRILTMLADEEVKHYEAVKQMECGVNPNMAETTILVDSKNIFAQMKDLQDEYECDVQQVELYKRAQEIEEKSRAFYSEKADEMGTEVGRDLLLKLAEEEKKHYFLLENIIEFVSRPETWLENAEFCHLEEY